MSQSSLLLLWLACGLLTFAIRYSFIALEGHYRPPDWFIRWLPFVPIAALTAVRYASALGVSRRATTPRDAAASQIRMRKASVATSRSGSRCTNWIA